MEEVDGAVLERGGGGITRGARGRGGCAGEGERVVAEVKGWRWRRKGRGGERAGVAHCRKKGTAAGSVLGRAMTGFWRRVQQYGVWAWKTVCWGRRAGLSCRWGRACRGVVVSVPCAVCCGGSGSGSGRGRYSLERG